MSRGPAGSEPAPCPWGPPRAAHSLSGHCPLFALRVEEAVKGAGVTYLACGGRSGRSSLRYRGLRVTPPGPGSSLPGPGCSGAWGCGGLERGEADWRGAGRRAGAVRGLSGRAAPLSRDGTWGGRAQEPLEEEPWIQPVAAWGATAQVLRPGTEMDRGPWGYSWRGAGAPHGARGCAEWTLPSALAQEPRAGHIRAQRRCLPPELRRQPRRPGRAGQALGNSPRSSLGRTGRPAARGFKGRTRLLGRRGPGGEGGSA